jgi:hypothetical protein
MQRNRRSKNEEYLVEAILDEKKDGNGNSLFLIKWYAWDEAFNTWEPIGHLQRIADHVEQFLAQGSRRKPVRIVSDSDFEHLEDEEEEGTKDRGSQSKRGRMRTKGSESVSVRDLSPRNIYQTPAKGSAVTNGPTSTSEKKWDSPFTFGKASEFLECGTQARELISSTKTSIDNSGTLTGIHSSPTAIFDLAPLSPDSKKASPSFSCVDKGCCDDLISDLDLPNTRSSHESFLFEDPLVEQSQFLYAKNTPTGLVIGSQAPQLQNLKLETHISRDVFSQFLAVMK